MAIHSTGSGNPNTSDEAAALGQQRPHPIGDGRVHTVKVAYLPYVAVEYVEKFTATPNVVQYMKDYDESRRLGTLLVFLDDGIASDDPLLAVPINLSVLLTLPQDQAYVGFTASTGLKWEKHDLLSWVWCDAGPCDPHDMERFYASSFDYAQKSKSSEAIHPRYNPGSGYGGVEGVDTRSGLVDGGDGAKSTRNESPDAPFLTREGLHEHNSAAYSNRYHHSKNRNEGLLEASTRSSSTHMSSQSALSDAAMQVPAGARRPNYHDPSGPADTYIFSPAGRFDEGTEIRL